jgi:hypothetical protein
MPTREFIKGHESRYMRPVPFVDKHPLKPVVGGGGECEDDSDCGEGEGVKEVRMDKNWKGVARRTLTAPAH